MFNWFSLDYIYYPVSAIMWVWYKAFAFLLGLIPGVDGDTNFFSWALSVMFLVFTLRAILYRPFVRQIETTRQMQELQPQIKALQKKYGKDRQRMALEMQKLQKEHGFNPILGCLPMLAQVPVFLGLYHVLMSFNRTQTGFGRLGLSVEEAAYGILRIANSNMARAVRAVSTERGHDIRKFALCAFGGAGGLHAAELARDCGIGTLLIPQEPGTMCARGILLSDISMDFVQTLMAHATANGWTTVQQALEILAGKARAWLSSEGVNESDQRLSAVIDARYQGQNFEIAVPLDGMQLMPLEAFVAAFSAAHVIQSLAHVANVVLSPAVLNAYKPVKRGRAQVN